MLLGVGQDLGMVTHLHAHEPLTVDLSCRADLSAEKSVNGKLQRKGEGKSQQLDQKVG